MSFTKNIFLLFWCFAITTLSAQQIDWMTWTEAAEANAKEPRKIFVDVYTDWCGWCKKMDQSTFKDSTIIDMMQEKFYAVKLNAEQIESIFWKDFEWKWVPGGRSGYNELAQIILERQMSFPSFVMLDSEYARIAISPGYKDAPTLLKELQFAAGEIYKTQSWEEFKARS